MLNSLFSPNPRGEGGTEYKSNTNTFIIDMWQDDILNISLINLKRFFWWADGQHKNTKIYVLTEPGISRNN